MLRAPRLVGSGSCPVGIAPSCAVRGGRWSSPPDGAASPCPAASATTSPGTPATVLLTAAGLAGVLVGSTLDAGLGTAVMSVSALVPSVVLGGALARTRTALASESWQRHRLAGEVAVSDEQVRRLADRVDRLADQGVDDAAELERTRRQLRRARVELAGSRAVLAGARDAAARDRAAADQASAAASRPGPPPTPPAPPATRPVPGSSAPSPRPQAAAREADELARTATGEQAAWRPAVRVEGQRSFASVDLRVFDAFTEADLADEDAVLDAPVRRGRHVADLDLPADAGRPPRSSALRRSCRSRCRCRPRRCPGRRGRAGRRPGARGGLTRYRPVAAVGEDRLVDGEHGLEHGEEPFDPEGVTFRRVSRRLTWVRLAGAGLFALLGVAVAVVLYVLLDTGWVLLVMVPGLLVGLLSALLVPAQVAAIGYAEREDDLVVRRGILFRSLTVVPYGRMQYVDVTAGPVDRALGLATVRLHTASAASDATVPGLTADAAALLRDRLTAAGQARLAGL